MILNGWGLGETHLGGYAEKARVKGDWLVRLPQSMSTREAMAIGTAGYTAMLAVMALERAGVTPARGAVSSPAPPAASARSRSRSWRSLAITVIASTGRPAEVGLPQAGSAPPR